MTKIVLLTFVELIRPPITAYELHFVASLFSTPSSAGLLNTPPALHQGSPPV
jgi:hypothetical protein